MSKGIYILIVKLLGDEFIKIGRLGKIHFKTGYYLYVGSSQINVEKRIHRHFNKIKQVRWHIDYLLENSKAITVKAIILKLSKKYECKISRFIESRGVDSVEGFGCSDCNCRSHLFYTNTNPEVILMSVVDVFNHKLTEIFPNKH